MDKWEYKIQKINPSWVSPDSVGVPDPAEIVEGYFNFMGKAGYEFVSFLPPVTAKTVAPLEADVYYAIFKKRSDD